jgi:hypothetical protein
MDDIVRQAMAKWPNVPHCYGWLALDARGNWRMLDERAQKLGLAGDKLTHPALVGFINRNYQSDERGCWFFQNGPQRVFVDLAAAPFVVRTDPQDGLLLHTGEAFGQVEQACMTPEGVLYLHGSGRTATVDDRDLVQLLGGVDEDRLLAWLADPQACPAPRLAGLDAALERADADLLARRFGFLRRPRDPDAVRGAGTHGR